MCIRDRSGTVNKITKFGAFVSLTDELEGFIRTTDFHWTKNPSHPKEFVNEGDSVEYLILEILEKERKVLLSIKDLTENPWEGIESKYNSGDKIKGSFEKMNDSGVIIKLDDEIEGLIPMNEISKDQKKNTISVLNEGDSLDLLVVEVKSEEKNITLTLKDKDLRKTIEAQLKIGFKVKENKTQLIVTWGENETTEFKRQSIEFDKKWKACGNTSNLIEVKGNNHFDIVFNMMKKDCALRELIIEQIMRVS